MQVTFHGAAQTVTGSMHLVEVNGQRLLLDCGLYQGPRAETYARNLHFPFDPATIDAVILSHAHIDHAGNLPNLVKQGFRGAIWATPATRDLSVAMLQDSGHIQESDVEFLNKRRARQGEPPVEPLYTRADALASLKYFMTADYERPTQVLPGVTFTFFDAGHILGSAMVQLDCQEAERTTRLVFSGDIGRKGLAILRDPTLLAAADYVIMESTYGDRLHETPVEAQDRLASIIKQTFRRRGKVIVPAFAVGRTQELVYALYELTEEAEIPNLPVYIDSPLATNITEVFRLHPECYDAETRQLLDQAEGRGGPFGFKNLRYVRDVKDSKALNFLRESAIIISASGMAETGRILHHLRNSIGDASNTILFVGFQAENTLGRRLLDGVSPVRIFGEMHTVRAAIERIEGYSAHGDRHDLLAWVDHMDHARLRQVFLVHGEPESANALADGIRGLGITNVVVPALHEHFELA
jgi:metallo-beta-lactamase family protein